MGSVVILDKKPWVDLEPLTTKRPSKNYIWNLLRQDIRDLAPQRAMDAACHSFLNYPLFGDAEYFGIDISTLRLLQGLRNYPAAWEKVTPILADITKPILLSCSMDLVVTTKTLSHIAPDLRPLAVDNLIDCVRPGGSFVLEVEGRDQFPDIAERVSEHFERVEVIYTISSESRVFEKAPSNAEGDILSLTVELEMSLPNDAGLHEGCYLRAMSRNTGKETPDPISLVRTPQGIAMLENSIPVEIYCFPDAKKELEALNELVFKALQQGWVPDEIVVLMPHASLRDSIAEYEQGEALRLLRCLTYAELEDEFTVPVLIMPAWEARYHGASDASERQRMYLRRRSATSRLIATYAEVRDGSATIISPYLYDL